MTKAQLIEKITLVFPQNAENLKILQASLKSELLGLYEITMDQKDAKSDNK